MANINTQDVSKAEEALELAKHDLIAFGKLFLTVFIRLKIFLSNIGSTNPENKKIPLYSYIDSSLESFIIKSSDINSLTSL